MFRGVKMAGIGEGFGILSDFKELSFCGPRYWLSSESRTPPPLPLICSSS